MHAGCSIQFSISLHNVQKSTLDLNRIESKPDSLSLSGVSRIISITEPSGDISPRSPSAQALDPAIGNATDSTAAISSPTTAIADTTIDPPANASAAAADDRDTPRPQRLLQTPVITEENEFGEPPHKSNLSLQVIDQHQPYQPNNLHHQQHQLQQQNHPLQSAPSTMSANYCPDGTPGAQSRRKLSVQGLMAFAERRRSSSTIAELRKHSIPNGSDTVSIGPQNVRGSIGAIATPGGPPTRSRPSSKMTKYVECWGADKPFANITDSTMAKNIGLASIAMIESNLLPPERHCAEHLMSFGGGGGGGCCSGPPSELKPVTMWYRDAAIERAYRDKADPHFRYDLICSFVMFVSLAVLQLIVVKANVAVLGSTGATVCTLGLFVYLSHSQLADTSAVLGGGNGMMGGPAQVIINNRAIRLVIFVVTNALIGACAVFSVINFEEFVDVRTFVNGTVGADGETRLAFEAFTSQSQPTETAPVYLYCCALSLASISAFLRAGCVLKFFAMAACVGLQGTVLWYSNLFRMYSYHGR